jgi:UDP-N-acetylglucosamine:LPS N-acetylglucosamine transferase
VRVGLVCSAGGHLAPLLWLRSWWGAHDRFWVTEPTVDARAGLASERVHWAVGPTNRSATAAVRNGARALSVLTSERPDVLVSTGAGVAVPWFAVGRLLGIPLVFIEVVDRVEEPSWSGRIVAPWCDAVVVQHPGQLRHYPQALLLGPIR